MSQPSTIIAGLDEIIEFLGVVTNDEEKDWKLKIKSEDLVQPTLLRIRYISPTKGTFVKSINTQHYCFVMFFSKKTKWVLELLQASRLKKQCSSCLTEAEEELQMTILKQEEKF